MTRLLTQLCDKFGAWMRHALFAFCAVCFSPDELAAVPAPVDPAPLFLSVDDPLVAPLPQYLAQWSVTVNEAAIRQPAAAIRLNGPDFPDTVVPQLYWSPRSGYIEIYNKDDPDRPIWIPDPNARPEDFSWHWYGKAGYVSVSLTVEAGVLAGRVWLRDRHYSLRPSPKGLILGETNSSYWRMHPGDDAEPATNSGGLSLQLPVPSQTTRPLGGSWDYSCSGPLPTGYNNIDVLVLYTQGTLSHFGSHANVLAGVRHAIDDANNALRNSRINTFLYHLRDLQFLAGDYDGQQIQNALYTFSGVQPTGSPPYCTIADSSDIMTLRNQLDADVVALARRDSSPQAFCGYSFIQRGETAFCAHQPGAGFERFAYLVFDAECGADRLNLAHELGHQLGADHDPRNYTESTGFTPSCPWSYGHRETHPTYPFRTVMAYPSEGNTATPGPACSSDSACPLIDAFSTPALEWTGPGGVQTVGTVLNAPPIGIAFPPPENWQQSRVVDTLQRLAPVTAAFRAREDLIHAHGFE